MLLYIYIYKDNFSFTAYDRLINNTTMPLDGPARILRFRLFKLGEPLDPVRLSSMYGRCH
jgi:hypothetical protein